MHWKQHGNSIRPYAPKCGEVNINNSDVKKKEFPMEIRFFFFSVGYITMLSVSRLYSIG
jgi:hypothetical protein